jgi:hypothetical protein
MTRTSDLTFRKRLLYPLSYEASAIDIITQQKKYYTQVQGFQLSAASIRWEGGEKHTRRSGN